MEIAKIKNWVKAKNSAQFTIRNKNLIHLHKLNRFITLGATYPYLGTASLIFMEAWPDLIHLGYILVDLSGNKFSDGVLPADAFQYNEKSGGYF